MSGGGLEFGLELVAWFCHEGQDFRPAFVQARFHSAIAVIVLLIAGAITVLALRQR